MNIFNRRNESVDEISRRCITKKSVNHSASKSNQSICLSPTKIQTIHIKVFKKHHMFIKHVHRLILENEI